MTLSTPATSHVSSHVTTHVLDTARGRPAAGMAVLLEVWRDTSSDDSPSDVWRWETVGQEITDADGRCRALGPEALGVGRYRLTFDTGSWFTAKGQDAFYPEVVVVFAIHDAEQHYHVPVLLGPFAYSTYRGS